MSTKDTGGTAFPAERISDNKGMTLRDYFAAKAMQALIGHVDLDYAMGKVSSDSYLMADQMIAARSKA